MGTKQISWLSGFSATGNCESARDFAHFLLGQLAERKFRARKLLLRESEEKIRLILGFVDGAKQFVASRSRIVAHARVVPGGDALGADLPRGRQQLIELHVVVAERARNRRAALRDNPRRTAAPPSARIRARNSPRSTGMPRCSATRRASYTSSSEQQRCCLRAVALQVCGSRRWFQSCMVRPTIVCAALVQHRRDRRAIHAAAHGHGHGVSPAQRPRRNGSSWMSGGIEIFRISPGICHRAGTSRRRMRRKRAQALHGPRNHAIGVVDFLGGRRPAQAEAQARPRIVVRKPDRSEHVRRFDGSRRARRAGRARHALQIERDHQRFALPRRKRQIGRVRTRDGSGRHSRCAAGIFRQQCLFQPVAQRADACASAARCSRASSAALPRPTMPGTFSVPGRRSRS